MIRLRTTLLVAAAALVACTSDHLITTRTPGGTLELLPSVGEFLQGETLQLTADVRTDADTLIRDPGISWTTSNAGVATVNSSGLVVGVAPGMVTIAARYQGQTAGRELTVLSNAPVSIWARSLPAAIDVGGSATIVVEVHGPGNHVIAAPVLEWQSAQPAIASVDGHGVVHGISPGVATIIVSSGTIEAGFPVLVRSETPGSIQIAPQPDLLLNGTAQLQATVLATDGSPLVRTVTWSVDRSDIVSVSSAGLVVGVASGTAVITARVGAVSAERSVSVLPYSRTYTSVGIALPEDMVVGDSEWVTVGGALSGTPGFHDVLEPLALTSDDSAIATFGPAPFALVRAMSAGTVTLRATGRFASGSTVLRIFPRTTAPAVPAVQSAQLVEYVGPTTRVYYPTVTMQETSGLAGYKVTRVHMALIGAPGDADDAEPMRVNPGASRVLWNSYYFDGVEVDVPLAEAATGATLEIEYVDDAGNHGTVTVTAPLASGD